MSGTSKKLLWFIGLWAAGVATVSLVAYAIRWFLMPLS